MFLVLNFLFTSYFRKNLPILGVSPLSAQPLYFYFPSKKLKNEDNNFRWAGPCRDINIGL